MPGRTYQDGVRDGEIAALTNITGQHKDRLDSHAGRIRALERIMWIMAGVLGTVQIGLPLVQKFVG